MNCNLQNSSLPEEIAKTVSTIAARQTEYIKNIPQFLADNSWKSELNRLTKIVKTKIYEDT